VLFRSEIAVIDGHVTILDDNYQPTDTAIRTGQSSIVCLSDDGRTPTCDFSLPQTIELERYGQEFCAYQNVPASLLNYPIELLCPGDPMPTDPIVESGSASPSESESVDCSTFELIGPFEGITPRFTTFEWTEAPGATEYFIVFYDYNGREAGAYPTQETNITLLMGQVPTGSELQWEVRAYADGEYACVTARTPVITRLADPNPPPSDPDDDDGALISWSCVNATTMRITWNLPSDSDSGPTITFNDYANGIFPATVSSPSLSGSLTYTWPAPVAGAVEVDSGVLVFDPPGASKGRTVNFGGAGLNCG